MRENEDSLRWAIGTIILFILGLMLGVPISKYNILIIVLRGLKSSFLSLPQDAEMVNQIIDIWIWGFVILGWACIGAAVYIIYRHFNRPT